MLTALRWSGAGGASDDTRVAPDVFPARFLAPDTGRRRFGALAMTTEISLCVGEEFQRCNANIGRPTICLGV